MCVCEASRLTFTQMCCCSFSPRQETESVFSVTQSESPSEHPASSPPLCSSLPASSTHTHWSKKPRSASLHPSSPPPPLSDSPSLSLCLTKSVHSHLISTRQNGDATTAGKVNYTIGKTVSNSCDSLS